MSDDFGGYNLKQLREALISSDINALADAGLIDEDALNYLITFEQAYQPESGPHHDTGEPAWYADETELWTSIVRRQVSKNLRTAVRNGNQSVIQFALGFVDRDETQMDFLDYERLRQVLTEPAFMLFIFGAPGAGKTFTAFRLAELWRMLTGGVLLTNVRSASEKVDWIHYVGGYADVIRYCIDHPNRRKLLIGDELSSLMSGYAGDRDAVESLMRPLTRKMRKDPFRMSFLGIGHRPQADIHPTLRNAEMANFAFKPGRTKEKQQKNLAIYGALNGDGGDEDTKLVEVSGIGLTNIPVDTDESGAWDWPDDEEALSLGYELKEQTGDDFLGLIHRFSDDDDEQDTVNPSDVVSCNGINKRGDRCGRNTNDKNHGESIRDTGYCLDHLSQVDEK